MAVQRQRTCQRYMPPACPSRSLQLRGRQVGLGGRRPRRAGGEGGTRPAVQAAGRPKRQCGAEGVEGRLRRREAQAEVVEGDRRSAAVGQWATLVRSRRYRSAVQQLRDNLQAQLLDSQAVCQQQAAQLRQAHAALEAARAECAALAAQLRDAEARHQQELEQAGQERQQEVAMLQQQADEQCQLLQQQADAAAAVAVAEAEQHCHVEAAARWAAAGSRGWPASCPIETRAWGRQICTCLSQLPIKSFLCEPQGVPGGTARPA